MLVELAKGKGIEKVEVPDKNIIEVLKPNEVKVELTGMAEVERALENPIGAPKLSEIVKPGKALLSLQAILRGQYPLIRYCRLY